MPSKCALCDADTQGYWVQGVWRAADAWKAFPVCRACHEQPSRRPGVKAHFFNVHQIGVGVAMAGSTSQIGG